VERLALGTAPGQAGDVIAGVARALEDNGIGKIAMLKDGSVYLWKFGV
jgi:hypothetical protein